MPYTDNEIIGKIRSGSSQHFAKLVDRYKDASFTLAVRMLKNREEAEEAAQDAFVRAYNALGKFEGTSSFKTWLYRIVYNVCLTRLAKRNEDVDIVDYDDEQEYDAVETSSTYSTDREFESNEMIALVKQSIDELPAKYASILTLWYFRELTHDELCEVTQQPLGTVKVQLFRARVLLRERLSKKLQTEKVMG